MFSILCHRHGKKTTKKNDTHTDMELKLNKNAETKHATQAGSTFEFCGCDRITDERERSQAQA